MVQNALCSPPGHGIRVILLAIGLYGNMEQVRGNGFDWDETISEPNAEIGYDSERYTCQIRNLVVM